MRELTLVCQQRDIVGEKGRLSLNAVLQQAHIDWHGVELNRPDWSGDSHSIAFTMRSLRARYWVHGMLNAYWEPLTFQLPPVPLPELRAWRRCLDTALPSPDDIVRMEDAPFFEKTHYLVQPRSMVILGAMAGTQRPQTRIQ